MSANAFINVLRGIEIGLSCVPIPGLAAVAIIVEQIYHQVEQIHVRKIECRELASFCLEVLKAISENKYQADQTSSSFRDAVQKAQITIKLVHEDTLKWKTYNRARAVLCNSEILDAINFHRAQIVTCLSLLGLAHVMQQTDWNHRFEQAQSQDMRALQEISGKQDVLYEEMRKMQEMLVDIKQTANRPTSLDPPQLMKAKEDLFKLRTTREEEDPTLPLRELRNECRKIGNRPIHAGSLYDVWMGLWLEEHFVALKVFRGNAATDTNQTRRFERQVDLWRTLNHENILQLYGYCTFADDNIQGSQGRRIYLVTPWMKIIEVAKGLKYLHTWNIMHGGLQGSNVLVNDQGSAVLSDFSLSKVIEDNVMFTQSNGPSASLRWMSPEAHNQEQMTPQADVYAWGMTALQILTGLIPFYKIKALGQLVVSIAVKGDKPKFADYPSPLIDAKMWSLFESCWEMEASRRPTIDQVLTVLQEISFERGKNY